MAEIEFDIDEDTITKRSDAYLSKVVFGNKKTSVMVRALKKLKLAKTNKQAYKILLILAISFFLITILLTGYITYSNSHQIDISDPLSPELRQQLEEARAKS